MNFKILLIAYMFLVGLSLLSAVSITDVSSSPFEVAPGKEVSISIEVENIFNFDVENLNVKLDLSGEDVPFAPYQSSSEKFLDILDKGDDDNFKFKLISLPSARTGIYKIPVDITYEYDDGNETLNGKKTELISIIINSEPKLKVSLDDSAALIKGKENTFSIEIVNSGLSDVKFVYLDVSNPAGIKFISDREKYIGDIDSDDFDSVNYQTFIDKDSPDSITLSVTLRFMDFTNKEFTETQNIILKTYSLKEARNLGLVKKPNYTFFIVISIIIAGYFLRRFLKKKKLKKLKK